MEGQGPFFKSVSRGSQAVCVEQSAGTVRRRRRIIELTNDSVSDSESNEIPTGGKDKQGFYEVPQEPKPETSEPNPRFDNRQNTSSPCKGYQLQHNYQELNELQRCLPQ